MNNQTVAELQELDKKFHVHPFTHHPNMHQNGSSIVFEGKGCFVKDEKGRELLDGLAGLWCTNIGYGREEMAQTIYEQAKKLAYYPSFFNTTTEPTIRLSAKLAQLAPQRLNHVMFCNSGSEANESALKLIRAYHKIKGCSDKKKILARTWSYHGVGIASASLTGLTSCQEPFDLPIPGILHVPGPYAFEAGKDHDPEGYGAWCIEETEHLILKEGPQTIAAIFVEPIQGAGGVIVPPKGYLSALRALCRKYEILFVADEVITGFGRVGEWFASHGCSLDPDILCTAKGLTSGYIPLGATLISDEIMDTLNQGGYIAHGFTYSGHPLATATALKNIEILENERLPQRVKEEIGPYFMQKMSTLRDHPLVGEVRGEGLICAVELLPKGGRQALKPELNLGLKMFDLVREEGAIVRGIRNLIAISPPLIIKEQEVDFLVEAIGKALDRLS